MARSQTCCLKPWNWAAWLWPLGAQCAGLRPLIQRWWLVSVLAMSGCQCGPTGRLTAIPEARLEIPDFQLGINCQEIVK
jgi:hypothetical protein